MAVLLLATVGAVAVQQQERTVRQQAALRVGSNADAAVRALVRQGEDFTATVQAGASGPQVIAALRVPGRVSAAAAEEDLATLALGKDAPAAFLSDLSGRSAVIYPAQPSLIGKDFSFRDWYRGVSATGRPYVSAAYRSAASGHPLVVGVAAPVVDGTRRLGYLTVLWQLDTVRAVAEGSLRDDGIALTVTDQHGVPLTDELAVDDRGQPTPTTVPLTTRQALAGRRVSTDRGGHLLTAAPVPGLGWTVTATMPTSVALAPTAAFRRDLLATVGVALLLVLAGMAVAGRAERRRARELTRVDEERRHATALFAESPIGILEGTASGTILSVNEALAQMLGYSVEELLTMNAAELADPSSVAAISETMEAVATGSLPSYITERTYRRRDGSALPVLVSVVVLRDDGETVSRMVCFVVDQRQQRAAAEALAASEDRFRRVFDEGLTGKALADETGVILRSNAALSALLGVATDELAGRTLSSLVEPADRQRLESIISSGQGELRSEIALRHAQGRPVWALVAVGWLTEPEGRRVLLAQVQDVTARRLAERRLTELALHDELTGLPNRRLLMERCEQAFAAARSGRSSTHMSALFVDLDGFKAVNDRAGHDAGDDLLVSIATDLVRVLRPSDTVARVGGDEFVVLLDQDEGLSYVRSVADRVGTTVRRQVVAGGAALTVSASIGIARVDLAHEPDVQPEQLLRRADAAMYQAKERGRDRHDLFDADLRERTEARHVLEQAVRDGLAQDRLALVYQPVVDVDSGLVTGAEALLRLTDRDGRALPTLPSIVAAEQAGLAERVGDRVLQLALQAVKTWPTHMSVAVNISARELTGRDFGSRVLQALDRNDVDPSRLVLEITESSILRAGPSALNDLAELRQQGVRVAIDDFGTAYATLQNLTVLPVDVLKIDSTFAAGLPAQKAHTAVVHGVISMAYELDVPCVVEGIETDVQLDALRGMSVHGQGWLWGQPRSGDVIPAVSPRPEAHDPAE
ncbi:MAG: EAL domain-containing protein [Mycobacteriales bacterium]